MLVCLSLGFSIDVARKLSAHYLRTANVDCGQDRLICSWPLCLNTTVSIVTWRMQVSRERLLVDSVTIRVEQSILCCFARNETCTRLYSPWLTTSLFDDIMRAEEGIIALKVQTDRLCVQHRSIEDCAIGNKTGTDTYHESKQTNCNFKRRTQINGTSSVLVIEPKQENGRIQPKKGVFYKSTRPWTRTSFGRTRLRTM